MTSGLLRVSEQKEEMRERDAVRRLAGLRRLDTGNSDLLQSAAVSLSPAGVEYVRRLTPL